MVLPPPGLSAIKESNLHKKVQIIVPEPFRHQYPAPSMSANASEKIRKAAKNKKATESKS